MKRFFLVLGALAIFYVLAWVGVSLVVLKAEEERAAQDRAVVALGQKLKPEVEGYFGSELLKEACKGKLTPGGRRSLALYTLPLGEVLPSLEGLRVDGKLAAWSGTYVTVEPTDPPPSPPSFSTILARLSSPDEWGWRLEKKDELRKETQELRYVAVALFSNLTAASLPFLGKEGTFDPGSADYKVKVVTFPDGKPVCEGTGEGRMVQKVIGHGKARDSFDAERAARSDLERKLGGKWMQATIGSPLEDLCDVGGEPFCFSVKLMTDGPDW